MRGYIAFLRKELAEIVHTWRLWVLPGILLFFAITGPLTARFTKELLVTATGGAALPIPVPDPTWRDTLVQWVKNLGQLGLLAVIIVFGGVVNGERRQGSDVLALTKPVSRTAYVLAKATSAAILLVGATGLAMLVEHLVALALFPDAQLGPLAATTGAWLVHALLIVAVLVLASAALDSGAAASGIGFGAVVLLLLASMWGPAARRSPAGIGDVVNKVAAGVDVGWVWPVGTSFVAIALLLAAAVLVYRRREL